MIRRFIQGVLWLSFLGGFLLLFASLAGYGARLSRYLELFSGQRLFYLWAGLLLLVFLLAIFRYRSFSPVAWRTSVVAMGIAFGVNAIEVFPYYPPFANVTSPDSVAESHPLRLRVITLNLLGQDNTSYDEVLAFLEKENADIIYFCEYKKKWNAYLEKWLNDYPYQVPRFSFDGMLISRYPVRNWQPMQFTQHPYGIIGTIEVVAEGTPITVIGCHAPSYFMMGDHAYRDRNALLTKGMPTLAANTPGPLVLVGDLNADLWSPWFQEFRSRSQLRDARVGFGVNPSDWQWPEPPLHRILGRPIDHCLVSEDVAVLDFRLSPPIGSDHLALIVDLAFPKAP